MSASKQYAVSMLIKADNRVGGPVRSVIGQFDRLGNKAAQVSRMAGFHKVRSAVKGLAGDISHLGGMVRNGMAPLLSLGGGASLAGIALMTTSVARAGDEYAKLSARLGMTSERLQGLQYAADRNGAAAAQFNTGMRDLTKNIGEAAAGTGEARSVFKALGIDLVDAQGRIKSTEDVFFELADVMPTIQDESLRLAAAQKIMGEGGGVMVNTLMQGSEEIKRLIKEKQRLGVITNEQSKLSEAFVDSQTRATSALKGVGYSIVSHLLPYAGPAIDRFADWIMVNKEFIGQNVGGFITRMGQKLEAVNWQGAINGVAGFVDWTGRAVQFVGGFDRALMIGGAVMAGPFVAATVQAAWGVMKLGGSLVMATANVAAYLAAQAVAPIISFFTALKYGVGVMHAMNIAMMANPVGLVIAGVVALGAAFVAAYKYIKPFRDLVDDIWEGIKNLASVAGDWMKDKLGIDFSAFSEVKDDIGKGLKAVTGPAAPTSGMVSADSFALQNGTAQVLSGVPQMRNAANNNLAGGSGVDPVSRESSGPMGYGDLTSLAPIGASSSSAQEITVRLIGFPANTEVEHKSDGGGLTAFNVVLDTGESTVGTG